jgi:hypothetical protein
VETRSRSSCASPRRSRGAGRARADDPAGSLRYDQLRPRPLAAGRLESLRTVLSYRALYVRRGAAAPLLSPGLGGGRLLVYYPDAELSDGAAELETRGFFDVFNTPPWDSWVALFRDEGAADVSYREYLLAWVPPAFVALAGRGIDVNPEGCIAWLADTDTPVARELRTRDLLR